LSDDDIGPSLVVSGTVDDSGASDFLLLSGESIFPTGAGALEDTGNDSGDQIELIGATPSGIFDEGNELEGPKLWGRRLCKSFHEIASCALVGL
jgi:hypothetical protein